MSFDKLKAARAASLTQLTSAAEKLTQKGSGDARFWAPTVDKANNGFAIIRFLPAAAGEDLPWTRFWDHGFKGPSGRWYIENSLTTIGQDDPVSEMNGRLWNSGSEKDKEIARSRKRRLHYVSNVLVISDPANPSAEGKVFLFKYGKKIFDKINDLMQPDPADKTVEPINPFDMWEGANFKLKIREVEGYRNYDKSEFTPKGPVLDGKDETLKELYDGLYSLKEFTDPKNFKSYAELKKKLIEVLGASAAGLTTAEEVEMQSPASAKSSGKTAEAPEIPQGNPPPDEDSDADGAEDSLSYFAKLANKK